MRTWFADIRFALRQLRKTPGFALLAVITLALGIGANTAMFTVMENVLLRPLPYPDAGRLVAINPAKEKDYTQISWLNYRTIQNGMKNVADVGAYISDLGVLQDGQSAVSVASPRVTPNLLVMLGAKPLMGRIFTKQDALPGGPKVVLLSEGIWRTEFHSDPHIVGQTVRIDGKPHTVVGVMPAHFRYPDNEAHAMKTGVWLPLQPTHGMLTNRDWTLLFTLAKLHSGVSMQHAQAQLDLASIQIRNLDKNPRGESFRLYPYTHFVVGNVRPLLISLSCTLALLLVIACANVAILLVGRAIRRQQEFAVRVALGAKRRRLVRQVMTEGALLSVLGCVAGFGLAKLAIVSLHYLPPDAIPRMSTIHIRWTVLLALGGIATITTILSSLLPALLVSHADPQPALQSASRGIGSRSVRGRLTGWLVAGEIALSTLLLVGTGLLAHTMWNLNHTWLGFNTTRVTMFQVMPPNASGFAEMRVVTNTKNPPASVDTLAYQPALQRLRRAPGFENAALISLPPFSGSNFVTTFGIVNRTSNPHNEPSARITAVSGGYARVMDTPVLRGRMVNDNDTADSEPVAVINQALAKKYFPGQNPIGHQLNLGGKHSGILTPPTIIGVIGNERSLSVKQPAEPLIMLPAAQIPTTSLYYDIELGTMVSFVVKTQGNVPVAREAKDIFHQVAPGCAVSGFKTMREIVSGTTFDQQLELDLTAIFAGLAILMVISGLFGVLSQLVGLRRREIGIRIALGASRQDVLRMVFYQSLQLAGLGLAAGLVISILAGHMIRSFLYGVHSFDLVTYAGVLCLLLFVSLIAAIWPAMQAASVDPMTTLRME